MPLNLLSRQQFCEPSAADGVLLTAVGTAWTNSAFVEILASAPSACILSGVTLRTTFNGFFPSINGEVDIATGAAASEVVIATVPFTTNEFGIAMSGPMTFVLPIGIDNIANNARLSARIRVSTTAAFTCTCAVSFFRKPLTGQNTYLSTSNAQKTLPSAADPIVLTASGSTWVYGSYAEIRTNSGAALIVVGLVLRKNDGSAMEIELATGAGGAESPITTIAIGGTGGSLWPGVIYLPNPLDNIAVNTRVAARVRAATGGANVRIALAVFEKPL